jgi:hypothetical protein
MLALSSSSRPLQAHFSLKHCSLPAAQPYRDEVRLPWVQARRFVGVQTLSKVTGEKEFWRFEPWQRMISRAVSSGAETHLSPCAWRGAALRTGVD